MSTHCRPRALGALLLLMGSLSACAATGRTPSDPKPSPPTVAPPFSATAAPAEFADRVPSPSAPVPGNPLTPAEIAYVDGTATAIYGRRTFERATAFVPTGDAGGHGICVRSPTDEGGYDVALVVIARRLYGDAISQVDDDTIVLRAAADTHICRTATLTYVAPRAD